MQIPSKSVANLWKAMKSEISHDWVVIEGTKLGLKSPMESFPSINLQSVAGWEYACLSQRQHSLSDRTKLPEVYAKWH